MFDCGHTNNYSAAERRRTKSKVSTGRLFVSINNSQSMKSAINTSIDELRSLHRKRMTSKHELSNEQKRQPTVLEQHVKKKTVHNRRRKNSAPKQQQKPSLKSIFISPVGTLTTSQLRSLCSSIRHCRRGQSLSCLEILERVLFEIVSWECQQQPMTDCSSGTTFLKPIHIFSTLTGLSNDIQTWKKRQFHDHNNHHDTSETHGEQINAKVVHRLIQVVNIVQQLKRSRYIDSGCSTKDVPSFATMIAAELSRWEVSATDAALHFLEMMEDEDNESNEWDPRLIGAVLDALARFGRAEDAQCLLGRAMGISIPNVDDKSKDAALMSTTKRLDPSHAGPCYDALLRSWSKKAVLLAQQQPNSLMDKPQTRVQDQSPSQIPKSAMAALSQGRYILLNHMPLQSGLPITNRTVSAVLHGYSVLGLGSQSESLLMEIEALHLSPKYRKSHVQSLPLMSMVSSSLDEGCYNTVLHACSKSKDPNAVICAERLFTAMKEQNYLAISVKNFTVTHSFPFKDLAPSSSYCVIPPGPDFISYSTMLNCYSKHHRLAEAEKLMTEMCDSVAFRPSVPCYLPLIQAFETSLEIDAPQRVLSLIERSEGSLAGRPSRLLYTAALRCMKQHGRGDLAEIILEIFQNAFPVRGGPDMNSHILVLRAWERTALKSDRQYASKRAEAFFQKMEKRGNSSQLPKPDVNAYNILINCYARAGDAGKAEKVLLDLESSTDQCLHPNIKSYSLVLKALGNSFEINAVDRAWNIMHQAEYSRAITSTSPLQESVPSNLSVDIFNAMLKLFAKRGMASEAEALLNKMDEIVDGTVKNVSPDIQSYEAVFEALGRSNDVNASLRAEALLTRLEVVSELGGSIKPSLFIYNILLNCYANAGLSGKAERLLSRLNNADSISIGSTIKAIANSGNSQLVSMARAESLANKLGTSSEVIYFHRLKLCQKWGLGDEAEQLLQLMEDEKLNPGVIHYTSALIAWAKSADACSSRRAELLFEKMGKATFDLDRAAYHGLLLNYSTKGDSSKARLLLRTMLGLTNVKPNKATFTMVIDSYARSKFSDAGQNAEELLDQMRVLHAAGNDEVEPDNITYASVIRCKQVSKNEQVKDLTTFRKLQLIQDLQLESWPFEDKESQFDYM